MLRDKTFEAGTADTVIQWLDAATQMSPKIQKARERYYEARADNEANLAVLEKSISNSLLVSRELNEDAIDNMRENCALAEEIRPECDGDAMFADWFFSKLEIAGVKPVLKKTKPPEVSRRERLPKQIWELLTADERREYNRSGKLPQAARQLLDEIKKEGSK